MSVIFRNTNSVSTATTFDAFNAMTFTKTITAGGLNVVAAIPVGYLNANSLSVASVIYGGQACSAVGVEDKCPGYFHVRWFYLINPPPDSNNLVVTFNTAPARAFCNLIAFDGVDQITPVRSGSYTTGGGTATAGGVPTGTPYSLTIASDTTDLTVSAECNGGDVYITDQTSDGYYAGSTIFASDHATTNNVISIHSWSYPTDHANASIAIAGFSLQAATQNTNYRHHIKSTSKLKIGGNVRIR